MRGNIVDNQILTGEAARKALRQQKTKGKCGYFEMKLAQVNNQWFVWDHRGGELRGIRQPSEEACKRYLL